MAEELALLKRKIDREIKARKQAEAILEAKALELYNVNQQLKKLNENLEKEVELKTKAYYDSENRYQRIIESMEIGLLEVDTEDRITRAFKWFCDMTGYEEKDLIGKIASEVFLKEDQRVTLAIHNKSHLLGQAGIYETQIKKENGELIWVLISGTPILNSEGKTIGSIGVHLDITNRKKLAQDLERAKQLAEEARQVEKQFLANMSHEIRTPLNAIIGMSHLLYDTHPSPKQVEYLNMVQGSAKLLHRLISDILDLSKIESGKMEVRKNEFDLISLIKNLEKIFQLRLANKPVTFTVSIDHRINSLLIGDDLHLNQILINLLGNAEKFTKEGSISLDVILLEKNEDQVLIEFYVCDSGIGIEQNKLDQIFKNFKQAGLDTRQKYGGTGLGLAISKQLVELQDGQINVSSDLGKGTCFTFTIPYVDSGKDIKSKDTQDKISPDQFKGMHILVVEDNTMNQKYISGLLKKWELNFDIAKDGAVAVILAEQNQYDLILMDLQMPIKSGYDATIDIRNGSSVNNDIPIIALTASALLEQKKKSIEIGMNDFLSKPFTPKQLLKVLAKFTRKNKFINNPKIDMNNFNFNKQLDSNHLDEFYGGDLEHAADMFETFFTDILIEIPKLQSYYEQENWQSLYRLAHSLKPTMPMVGLTWLEEQFFQLEQIAKINPQKETIAALLLSINTDIEKYKPVLQAEFEKLTLVNAS